MNQEYIQETLAKLQIDKPLIDQIVEQISDEMIDDWHRELYYDMESIIRVETKSHEKHLIYRQHARIDEDSIVEANKSTCQCIATIEHIITILAQNGDTQVITAIDHLQVDAQF